MERRIEARPFEHDFLFFSLTKASVSLYVPERQFRKNKEISYFKVITKTRLYNFDLLKTHFCLVKLGFTGVYIIFLISAQKHRLC